LGHKDSYGEKKTQPGTDLGTLGGDTSLAQAINSRGDVVGRSTMKDDTEFHAFLYTDHLIDLNDCIPPGSGIVLAEATGINDRGQIVCNGMVNGHSHALRLIPLQAGR
jgi:probable HAF family extracellular repeat protein